MRDVCLCGLAIVIASQTAHASTLGSDGRLVYDPDALATVDFDDADATAAVVQSISLPSGNSNFVYTPMTATQIAPYLVTSSDALQGKGYLHWQGSDGAGLAWIAPTTFAAWQNQRIVVSFWGRAEGLEPYLAVTYGNASDLPSNKTWGWARIAAIRTGLETDDGWVEYSSGPIDGAVMGRPIHDIVLSGRLPTTSDTYLLLVDPPLHPTDAFSLDAIEVTPAPGEPATGTCTMATMDSDCGATAECFYGRCVDAAAVWGPVPPLPMQQEIVARVAMWASHVLGDRSAAARVDATWLAATAALASASATPKTFWAGLNQQVVAIRDTHTHLGSPYVGLTTPFLARPSLDSGPLDLCFGPTVNDLGDGQLAYVLWNKGTTATAPLEVGDVITAIDGLDPKTWVDMAFDRYVESLPTVATADWAPSSRDLSTLLAQHASTVSVTRCVGTTCSSQPDIDVPSYALAATNGGVYSTGTLICEPRFHDVVSGPRTDADGGELFLSTAVDASTLGIEFDGFEPSSDSAWEGSVQAAFALPHSNVLVDAREGFGGKNLLGNYLQQQFRSTSAPAVLVLAARGTIGAPDDPSLFAFDWTQCTGDDQPWQCPTSDIYVYGPTLASPPALASKVAWLDTDDVSNNDMVPRLLSGRASLQIFAPFSSYGALGSDVVLPALMPNWHDGTIAASDGRYSTSIAGAEATQMCQSGTGVQPDVVVTQTLSDVLAGQDTIVNAATAWLNQ
jgi:hypothetical protein